MGVFGFLALMRRGRRVAMALFALGVAVPTVNYLWPNAVAEIVEEIRSPPSTTAP